MSSFCAYLSFQDARPRKAEGGLIFRALQGMIMDFVFFMFFAAICFSGLLFTLHHLGTFQNNFFWFDFSDGYR